MTRPLVSILLLASCGVSTEGRSDDGGFADGGSASTGKRLFLSPSLNGALSGAASADDVCQSVASNAKLPGTWRAVIGADALARFVGPGPFLSVNGTVIFLNRADLAGAVKSDLHSDANGDDVGSQRSVWTGRTNDCKGWTSNAFGEKGTIGELSPSAGTRWLDLGTYPCSTSPRLLCSEQ